MGIRCVPLIDHDHADVFARNRTGEIRGTGWKSTGRFAFSKYEQLRVTNGEMDTERFAADFDCAFDHDTQYRVCVEIPQADCGSNGRD